MRIMGNTFGESLLRGINAVTLVSKHKTDESSRERWSVIAWIVVFVVIAGTGEQAVQIPVIERCEGVFNVVHDPPYSAAFIHTEHD